MNISTSVYRFINYFNSIILQTISSNEKKKNYLFSVLFEHNISKSIDTSFLFLIQRSNTCSILLVHLNVHFIYASPTIIRSDVILNEVEDRLDKVTVGGLPCGNSPVSSLNSRRLSIGCFDRASIRNFHEWIIHFPFHREFP